jgi:hypothetical protein
MKGILGRRQKLVYLKLLPVRLYFVRIRSTDVCHGSQSKIKKISVATPCVRSSGIEAANARRADSSVKGCTNPITKYTFITRPKNGPDINAQIISKKGGSLWGFSPWWTDGRLEDAERAEVKVARRPPR